MARSLAPARLPSLAAALLGALSVAACDTVYSAGSYPVRADLAQQPLVAESPDGPYWVVQQPVIYFGFDSAALDAEAINTLSVLAHTINHNMDYSIVNVVVRGHTDSVGGDAYNEDLGRRRAQAVRQYLVEEGGVDRARVYVRTQGEAWPADDVGDHRRHAANRRVEITFPRR